MDKKADSRCTRSNENVLPLLRWIDRRTGLRALAKKALDEPIPGGARMAYVFGSGLLFIFILQVVTGVCLALYYVPSAETAHTSVAYITKQVAAGAFLRSMHSYGSSAMVIVLALHFLQTFLYGSFKGRRELLWISGALLSFLILGMGFTGYLLPWDQKAYFATSVGTSIISETPLIGNWLMRVVRGGDTIGTLTLSRFYVAHVFLIPAAIFAFIGAHVFLFRKAGPAGPPQEDPIAPKLAPEPFYPRQVLMDMSFALLLIIGLGCLSFFHPAGLGPIANPADTQFLPRPEWYYLPMFEWLKFWEGPKVVIGVIVLPGMLAMAFFLMPFLDRKLERQAWRRPIPVLAVSIVIAGMIYLGARSRIDDRSNPQVADRLAIQTQQEQAYSAEPFHPFVESREGAGALSAMSDPAILQVAVGKGIFTEHGCSGCHGAAGTGTMAAPSLVGVTIRIPAAQISELVHNPNPRMRAGHMPATDLAEAEMSALLSFLGVLGSDAARVPAVFSAPSNSIASRVEFASLHSNDRSKGAEGLQRGEVIRLSAAAALGKQIFNERGCFACHGQEGRGGRAPALAPLIANAPDALLSQLLQNPSARMKAGGMPSVDATPQQISALVAFLRSINARPLDGQPGALVTALSEDPKPETSSQKPPTTAESAAQTVPAAAVSAHTETAALNTAHQSEATPAVPTLSGPASLGRGLFVAQGCIACHGSTAGGTHFAPSLIGVATKFPGEKLPALLRHPTRKMLGGGMPTVGINDAQMSELVKYLCSLEPTPPAPPPSPIPVTVPDDREIRVASAGPSPSVFGKKQEEPTYLARREIVMDPLAMRGRYLFEHFACETCHGVGGLNGTVAAPGLAGTASGLPESILENLLRHHTIQMKRGGMPQTNFHDQDMRAIIAFIRSLSTAPSGQ